ncbi:MAG: dTDP-4-dehydrorhamnose reductase [Candidatus Micrarchaeota archaeon]|nr:dTDP-4-dehydrorhamnose reductase [Candidatus Micrarchaeota archaeon]
MRILVIGASGLLGQALIERGLAAKQQMYGTYHSSRLDTSQFPAAKAGAALTLRPLDLSDERAILALLNFVKPNAVIYAAGFHPVDACEKDPAGARQLHVTAPSIVSAWCAKHGASMAYLSTDYVFDGAAGYYDESAAPGPQSVYARTKLEGENSVLAQKGAMCVVRTSVIYGAHDAKQNFVTWLISQLRAKKKVEVVTDQFSTPTYVEDLAAALLELARAKRRGLYHGTGRSCLSRYEFALMAADVFGLDQKLIRPIKTSSLKQAAKRPENGCLIADKIEQETGVLFSTAREGLGKLKEKMGAHNTRKDIS